MYPHCLIFESSAVLSQDSAKAIVQLLTALNGFVRECQTPPSTKSPHPVEPMVWHLQNMTTAVASATSAFRGIQALFVNYAAELIASASLGREMLTLVARTPQSVFGQRQQWPLNEVRAPKTTAGSSFFLST